MRHVFLKIKGQTANLFSLAQATIPCSICFYLYVFRFAFSPLYLFSLAQAAVLGGRPHLELFAAFVNLQNSR
jgi:hypothetical protein